MAEPLKEMFNARFYQDLSKRVKEAYPTFNEKDFIKDTTFGLEHLSLNERLRNTSLVLNKYLPANYLKSLNVMYEVIENSPKGYVALVFPDYVGLFGHEHFEQSMEALKFFTSFGSSEFAIREFLKRDFDKTIKVMERWANDTDHHVRRLASEGSRPRLPWSFKLDRVIQNPSVTKRVLDALKSDTELYVKKSVANHLNDISKDNPEYMLSMVESWDHSNADTKWIVKHASRTLIKKGDKKALQLFAFEKNVSIRVEAFKLNKKKIKLGESLQFDFDIVSTKKTTQKLVVDYIVYYAKKGAERSEKVFKLKELELKSASKVHVTKKQLFKDFSTRKHYKGKHSIELMINGKSYGRIDFELLA
ncbi:MAG: DNA alkylation repair protein [Bacteroidia bacterium]|nr:DNA alkylation repair protein [Bacteroidia bacterium]